MIFAGLAVTGAMQPLHPWLVALAGFTLVTYFVLRFATLYYALRRDGYPMRDVILAFSTHVGLGWTFSTSWLKCLWNDRQPFVRTNKFLGQRVPGVLQTAFVELSLGVVLLAASVILAFTGFILGPIAALLMFGARFAVLWVSHQMNRTVEVTERLLQVPSIADPVDSGVEISTGIRLSEVR